MFRHCFFGPLLIALSLVLGTGQMAVAADDQATIATDDSLIAEISSLKRAALTLRDSGDLDGAMAGLQHAINQVRGRVKSPAEFTQMAWLHAHRGYIGGELMGDFLTAKKAYTEALNIFEQIDRRDLQVGQYVHHPLANILTRLGENDHAISLLQHLITQASEEGEIGYQGDLYNDLGRAYLNKGDQEQARLQFQNGLKLADLPFQQKGLLHNSLAEVAWELGEVEQTQYHCGQAIRWLRSLFIDGKPERHTLWHGYLSESYLMGGLALDETGEVENAEAAIYKALEYAHLAHPSGHHRIIAKAHVALGNHALKKWELKSAEEEFKKAIAVCLPGWDASGNQLPNADDLYAETALLNALRGLGEVKLDEVLGHPKSTQWKIILADSVPGILEPWLLALDMEPLFREHYLNESSKLDLLATFREITSKSLFILQSAYRQTNQVKWVEQAFFLSERSKGVLLSASTRGLWNQMDNPELSALIAEEDSLTARLGALKREIRGLPEVEESETQQLKSSLVEVRLRQQQIREQLQSDFPEYSGLRFGQQVDLNDLQGHLVENETTLLSYYYDDERWYVFRVDQDGIDWYEPEDASDAGQLVKQLLAALHDPGRANAAEFANMASNCAQAMIPVEWQESLRPRLMLAPDGPFWRVPFEVLVTQQPELPISYRTLPYLIREHSVQYVPSARFLLREGSGDQPQHEFLGLAPTFETGSGLAELRGSEQAVQALSASFDGQSLSGPEARKEAFMEQARDYRILHLSSHALADLDHPDDSRIAFYPGISDDHWLYANDLMGLGLRADLVTLTACETGAGREAGGEGLLSLSRGFAHSGSRNILSTAWSVNFQTTLQITNRFYAYLNNRVSFSRALQLSKLDYLDHSQTDELGAHPYYWSGLMLIGQGGRLDDEETWPSSIWTFMGIGFLGLILLTLLVRRRFLRKKE